MADKSDAPLPPGAANSIPKDKPPPKNAATALLQAHEGKKKFDSADWAGSLQKPKDAPKKDGA